MLEYINSEICNAVQNDELNNADLVQLIELCAGFLNLQTVSDYAKNNKLSYNGVLKRCNSIHNNVNIIDICGARFIIDNE